MRCNECQPDTRDRSHENEGSSAHHQQAFVILTSFAPTTFLWPPLVCQDYGSCTSAGQRRTLKKATQRTSLQKEAITSWKGILTGALCGWAELGKTCEMR